MAKKIVHIVSQIPTRLLGSKRLGMKDDNDSAFAMKKPMKLEADQFLVS